MSKRSSANIRKLVLDVLKPHSPTLPEFAAKLGAVPGVSGANVTLIEIDKDTETVKVTVEGELDYGKIRAAIEEWGGVIHSVDEVSTGSFKSGDSSSKEKRSRLRTQEDKD